MTAPKAIACGGILIDSVVTACGRVNEKALGGNAVYSAAGLRLWLGAGQVGIVGHIPVNYPDDVLCQLQNADILTDGVHRSGVSVRGPEWFYYAPDGSRRDEISSPADGDAEMDFPAFRRAHPIRPNDIPVVWRDIRGIHLAGNDPVATRDLAATFRGASITLDPGARAADLAAYPDQPKVLAAVTAVIPSLKELQLLVPDQAPQAGLFHLSQRGAPLALVKRGSKGVLLRHPDGQLTEIPAIPVSALDPTGAGDSFCGGFLAGLLLGRDPVTAACMGTVAASFAVENFGPSSLLAAPCKQRDDRLANLMALVGRHSSSQTKMRSS